MKYECINGWTKRKMINHIKKNFKGKSVDEFSGTCLYRGPNSKKCVVGIFIPDNLYNNVMDNGLGLSTITNTIPMPLQHSGMANLQDCHDKSMPKNTLNDILDWIDSNVK